MLENTAYLSSWLSLAHHLWRHGGLLVLVSGVFGAAIFAPSVV